MLAYKFVIIDQQVEQRILTLANAIKQKKELQKKQQQSSSGNRRLNNLPQQGSCLSVSNACA
eukprot:scaffold5027_cov79-Cylindrotheca_fusiformis.AAC.1